MQTNVDSDDDLETILGSIPVKKEAKAAPPAPKVAAPGGSVDSTMKDFIRQSSSIILQEQLRRPQSPAEPRRQTETTTIREQPSSTEISAILAAIQSLELQRAKIRDDVETEYKAKLADMERRLQREYELHARNADLDKDSQKRAHDDRNSISDLVSRVTDIANIFQTEQQQLLANKDKSFNQRESLLASHELALKQEKAKLSELMNQLNVSTKALTEQSAAEAKRLDSEHARLAQLEQTTKELFDSHKGVIAMKTAAIEAGKRELADDRITFAAEKRRVQEEQERQERLAAAEWEKIRQAKLELELLLSSCSNRVQATEAGLDESRKAILRDVDLLEDKRRRLNSDMSALKVQQAELAEQKANIDEESKRLADAAIKVNMKSEEVVQAFSRAVAARDEVLTLCAEVNKEKENLQDESEKLRSLQTWIEQEKLHVLRAQSNLQKSSITGDLSPTQFTPQVANFKLNIKKQITEESKKWDRLRKEAEEFDSLVDDLQNKSLSARSRLN